jgi:hydroxylamine reductase (hybrid-cluster protein)
MMDPTSSGPLVKNAARSTRAAEGKTSARKRREKSSAELARVQKEALLRLQHLRSAAREVARQHLANMERDIVELADLVKNAKSGSRKGKNLSLSRLEHMITLLDNLSIKPEKGRRKDLKRIEEALEEVRETVITSRE